MAARCRPRSSGENPGAGQRIRPQTRALEWKLGEEERALGPRPGGRGRMGRMQGMRWAGNTSLLSSADDKQRADRWGPVEGPNAEKKTAIWPTSRVSGEQASSPAEGRNKAQGHPVTVPGQAWAGPRCPTATWHWATGLGLTPLALRRLWAVRQRS